VQPLPVTAVWLCRQERERKRPPVGGQGAQGAPTVAPPDAAASDNGAGAPVPAHFQAAADVALLRAPTAPSGGAPAPTNGNGVAGSSLSGRTVTGEPPAEGASAPAGSNGTSAGGHGGHAGYETGRGGREGRTGAV